MFTCEPENPVSQLFWGRTKIIQATSLFKFEKGSAYQVLLHKLKYRGEKKNGIYLGKLLGKELKNTVFGSCDYIVPVPLHPKKLRKRGFNQASVIARGVSSIIQKPVLEDFLIRRRYSGTQTKKNRFERFLNMESVFILNPKYISYDNHKYLLIDDVVTTGSTLEACSEAISNKIFGDLYAATVAYA
jgi:ComF family protein